MAVYQKPDSQDFYSGDPAELLEESPRPGAIVDSQGRRLGTHAGYWHYTIGQRRGLGIAAKAPLYVTAINACRNEIVVSETCQRHHFLTADKLNWTSIPAPEAPFEAEVKVRSGQTPVICRVTPLPDGSLQAEIPEGIPAISPGQSAVFYQGEVLLGGGIINEAKL